MHARPLHALFLASLAALGACGGDAGPALDAEADTAGSEELATLIARTTVADAMLNEMTTHRVIHEWLADAEAGVNSVGRDWTRLNERVYAEIFLTPASDPWLGLRADDVWDAIESAGQ